MNPRDGAARPGAAGLILLVALTTSALVGVQRARHAPSIAAPPPAAPAAPQGGARLWIDMRNVNLHVDERAAIRVRRLRGEVLTATPGDTAVLDDPRSFRIRITSGTVALGGDDLSALLNEVVFGYPGSPLRKLRVRMQGASLVQSGVMRKGVDLPFTLTATPKLEPDGSVRLHPTKLRLLGVDGAKLISALGLHLDRMLDLRGAHGARVQGDDILLDPTAIVPPPTIEGRLASIRVQGDELVQEFVRTPDDTMFDTHVVADSAVHNYVYFRGGRLRFGRLLMSDTDLLIADADERNPFDLFLARYAGQLVAGFSQTLPSSALRVTMPDYAELARYRRLDVGFVGPGAESTAADSASGPGRASSRARSSTARPPRGASPASAPRPTGTGRRRPSSG